MLKCSLIQECELGISCALGRRSLVAAVGNVPLAAPGSSSTEAPTEQGWDGEQPCSTQLLLCQGVQDAGGAMLVADHLLLKANKLL